MVVQPHFLLVLMGRFGANRDAAHVAHGHGMGSTYAEGFPEIWPHIRMMFQESIRAGVGQNVTADTPLFVERNGWKEEAYFSGSFIPIGPPNRPLSF